METLDSSKTPNPISSSKECAMREYKTEGAQEKKRPRLEYTGAREGCKCATSGCWRKYCPCFKVGAGCSLDCTCHKCVNPFNSNERVESIEACKGCNCKISGCCTKYCRCYKSGAGCSTDCGCQRCSNPFSTNDSPGSCVNESEDNSRQKETAVMENQQKITPEKESHEKVVANFFPTKVAFESLETRNNDPENSLLTTEVEEQQLLLERSDLLKLLGQMKSDVEDLTRERDSLDMELKIRTAELQTQQIENRHLLDMNEHLKLEVGAKDKQQLVLKDDQSTKLSALEEENRCLMKEVADLKRDNSNLVAILSNLSTFISTKSTERVVDSVAGLRGVIDDLRKEVGKMGERLKLVGGGSACHRE